MLAPLEPVSREAAGQSTCPLFKCLLATVLDVLSTESAHLSSPPLYWLLNIGKSASEMYCNRFHWEFHSIAGAEAQVTREKVIYLQLGSIRLGNVTKLVERISLTGRPGSSR